MKNLFFSILLLFIFSCTKNSPKSLTHDSCALIIDSEGFDKIKAKRDEALKLNHLYKSPEDYVNGKFVHNGETTDVKVRLKGDHTDHLKGNKWSFRLISDEPNLFRHYKISIQGTKTRNNMVEWIYHQLLKNEGLIHLQYKFIPFSVNDTLEGIYAMESHFDNHLLDMANRPHGPILKFDESDFWSYGLKGWKGFNDDSVMIKAEIKVTNKHWLKKSKNNRKLASKAINIIDSHRKGGLDFKDDFDLDKWARFIAVNELMYIDHSLRWHNLRFYFNPETKKIEPIGFDNGSWFSDKYTMFILNDSPEAFYKEMLQDDNFRNLIVSHLNRMTDRNYMESFFQNHKAQIDSLVQFIQEEIPEFKFKEATLYKSQRRILEQMK